MERKIIARRTLLLDFQPFVLGVTYFLHARSASPHLDLCGHTHININTTCVASPRGLGSATHARRASAPRASASPAHGALVNADLLLADNTLTWSRVQDIVGLARQTARDD